MVVWEAEQCSQPCSVQLAEPTALTHSCELTGGYSVNIHTDFAYVYAVCHLLSYMIVQRFPKDRWVDQIERLILVLMKPSRIAVLKCAAHRKDSKLITIGNNAGEKRLNTLKPIRGKERHAGSRGLLQQMGRTKPAKHKTDMVVKFLSREVIARFGSSD